MAVGDYDLVVIGDGAKARAIALKAARLKARVALVTSGNPSNWVLDKDQLDRIISQVNLQNNSLSEILESMRTQNDLGEDLEFLQSVGVDVVIGKGNFYDYQTLIVDIFNSSSGYSKTDYSKNTRKLRSRQFVIARDPSQDMRSPMRKIVGLNEIEYLTYNSLFNLLATNSESLISLTLLGGNALNCAIAQMLNNLGIKIRILAESHILPEFDLDSARILQTHLELQGIEILTGYIVTGISDREIWVNTATGTSRLDRQKHILIPTFIDDFDLNFSKAGIDVRDGEIRRNSKLQTTNPHIYICSHIRDIDVILKNCLFLPIAKIEPCLQSYICLTKPVVASMGLTEIDARLRYGRDLYMLQSFRQKHEQSNDLEFYKVLYRGNGEIVGAHFIGDRARELLSSMAIIMQNKIKLSNINSIEGGLILEICQEISTSILIKNWRSPWYKLFRW